MHQNVQLIYIIAVHNNNMDQEKQGKPKEQGNDIPTQTHDENQNKPNQIAPLSRPLIHTEGTSAFSPYLSREHFQPQKQQASQTLFGQIKTVKLRRQLISKLIVCLWQGLGRS
jgi:hypothetical protein